jgi:hypothetical protein
MKQSSCLKQLQVGLLLVFGLFVSPSDAATKAVASRTAEVDGVQLHYLTAGHAPTVILLHGYAETEKLVVMDAFLPGVAGREAIYNSPNVWHFRFNGEYPEALVKGRERVYFEYFWNVFAADKNHSIPEADRKAYTEAYSLPRECR